MRHTYKEYHVICDKCETNLIDYGSSTLYSPEERDRKMKQYGWVRIEGLDYCEKCKSEADRK